MTVQGVSRRHFIRQTGALIITFSLSSQIRPSLAWAQSSLPRSLANQPDLDAWIRISSDNTVTIFTGKVELGQGITTALAQIAAEELNLSLDQIEMVSGDTARTPDEGSTTGSRSIEVSGAALRAAAAEARGILLDLAVQKLAIAPEKLEIKEGVIRPQGKIQPRLSYGELIGDRRFNRQVSGSFSAKRPEDFQLVGRPLQRLDIPSKVMGLASFVHDLQLPEMLHGRVLRPPSYGARLEELEVGEVGRMPGIVQVIRDGNFVAVIAQREEQAVRAVEILGASSKWSPGRVLPSRKDFFTYFRKLAAEPAVVRNQGDAQSALNSASTRLEATFTRPYQAHASAGPSCAVAEFRNELLTVWTHSQGVYALRRELSQLLDIPVGRIRVVHKEGAGCFGHNGADDAAADAALLAKVTAGRPVRVQWRREDEFAWEPFGSAMAIDLKGGIDKEGNIVAWDCQIFSDTHSTRPGNGGALLAGWHLASPLPPRSRGSSRGASRNAEPLYNFPNTRIVTHRVEGPLRVSALRSLGAYANVFALESFMDELAFSGQADPLQFRLRHLKDPRAREVLNLAAEKGDWKLTTRSDGRGSGIAFAQYKNSAAYMAVVAEVEVEKSSGQIRVVRTHAAVDAGQIINPDGLKNQVEGGILQATSWTLKEEVLFNRDGVASRDWTSYPILTLPEAPAVEVSLIDRPKEAPLGAGEVAQGPTAAAIANAIFDAIGVRLRDLPFTPERVKAALS